MAQRHFRARAGHGSKRTWPAVSEIFGPVDIPLLGHLRNQAINLVLPKQVKAGRTPPWGQVVITLANERDKPNREPYNSADKYLTH